MRYSIEQWKVDLGETPIENMFLNTYMLMAPGDCVKVYLYGYKQALDGREASSLEEDAKALQMTPEQVKDCWTFWEEMGLVRQEGDGIRFLSLRQLYLGIESDDPHDVDYYNQPEEMLKASDDDDTKMMIEQIESILAVPLRPNQVATLLTQMKDYPVGQDVVVMSFVYAFETLETRDFDYALGVWRKWYIAGVRTGVDLEKHLDKEKEKKQKSQERQEKRAVKTTNFTTQGQGQDRMSEDEMNALIQSKLKRRKRGN